MFLAPSLYIAHAVMTGIMMFIVASFHWLAGFSFSAGLIDYILSFGHKAILLSCQLFDSF